MSTVEQSGENVEYFEELAHGLMDSISDIKTLEILAENSSQVALKTKNKSDSKDLQVFFNLFDAKPYSPDSLQNLNVKYQGLEYLYFMEDHASELFFLYGWLSNEAQDGKKKGLIALGYKPEKLIFISTCDIERLRSLTAKMISELTILADE